MSTPTAFVVICDADDKYIGLQCFTGTGGEASDYFETRSAALFALVDVLKQAHPTAPLLAALAAAGYDRTSATWYRDNLAAFLPECDLSGQRDCEPNPDWQKTQQAAIGRLQAGADYEAVLADDRAINTWSLALTLASDELAEGITVGMRGPTTAFDVVQG